jgi:hypothetical protein
MLWGGFLAVTGHPRKRGQVQNIGQSGHSHSASIRFAWRLVETAYGLASFADSVEKVIARRKWP